MTDPRTPTLDPAEDPSRCVTCGVGEGDTERPDGDYDCSDCAQARAARHADADRVRS